MKKMLSLIMAFCVVATCASFAIPVSGADENSDASVEETIVYYSSQQAELTFSDGGIFETKAGSGYSVDGTVLTIASAGTYRINGKCSEGTVIVGKGLGDVTLILDNLELSSAMTAPIVIKKTSNVLIILEGNNTLTDNEDATTEETNENFEGACIKVKSGSSLTFYGDGTLNAVGNAKNGIKGGAESTLLVDGGNFVVTAANNGIGFDGGIVINDGTFNVTSGNDGIKAVPDEGDTASAGTVEINGGKFTVNAQGDGIQAGTNLTVSDGTFDIKTENGYDSTTFDSETMSCKGLKASGTDSDTEDATNTIEITGGTFNINTADDAVHSDAYAIITGGTFYIYTGDDGVHADTTLELGKEGGYERDPEIYVYAGYEGLEAGTVNAYSGKYHITVSDDGINAAGGSSSGEDAGFGGGSHFNPGGGRPGGFGGNQPGGTTSSGDYSLNFYGGDYYINCTGDGLDSNGELNMYGGTFTVLSQATGGDNSPLDSDGTLLISGATVFAAGTNPMNENPSSASRKYYSDTTRRSAGVTVNVSYDGSLVYSEKLVRNINYLLYSSPSMTSTNCTVSTSSDITACKGNAWEHAFDGGVTETEPTFESNGVIKYTCTSCKDVERKTLTKLKVLTKYVESEEEKEEDKGFFVLFSVGGGASINVYYTQDYTSADEVGVTNAVSRNSTTGDADGTGAGQVNFAIEVAEGYEIGEITVEGTYNALKDVSTAEIANLYRITKVSSDLTVTVTTSKTEPDVFLGDVNGDGIVTTTDLKLLQKYVSGKTDDGEIVLANADLNGDGLISVGDVKLLKKLIQS